jgi:hypothetical protein
MFLTFAGIATASNDNDKSNLIKADCNASSMHKHVSFVSKSDPAIILAASECDRSSAIDCIRGNCDTDDSLDSNEYYQCKQQCLEAYGC